MRPLRGSLPLLACLLLAAAGCGGPGAEPTKSRNTLNWQAGVEDGVFGYLVYRSENREGPFRRINERIVRVPRDRQDTHDYTFVDDSVESGTTYYYYLDAVTTAGIKQRFSGIIDRTTP